MPYQYSVLSSHLALHSSQGGGASFPFIFCPWNLATERSADAQDGWQQNLFHFLLFWLSFVPLNRRYIFNAKHLPPSSGYLGEKILFSGSVSWRNCLYNPQWVLQDLSPSSIIASSLLDAWRFPNYKFSLRASLYSSKKYTAISQTWNFSPNS